MEQIIIGAMRPEDWEAVREIYRAGLATGQASFETAVSTQAAWNKSKRPDCRLVARSDAQVVGWAALSPISSRAVYAGVAEVSVYVAAEARGQGLGKRLLQALINASEQAGVWMLQASIFPENVASVELHKTCGFRTVGTRNKIAQHHGLWRDTVILERRSTIIGIEA